MNTRKIKRVMKKNWIYGFLLLVMISPACKKFLDIDRSTDANPTPITVGDFEQILNSTSICELPLDNLLYITDDSKMMLNKANVNTGGYIGFYLWRPDAWLGGVDNTYNQAYQSIAQMNLLIEKMSTALPVGENGRRAIAIAQAKINRAFLYLVLANIYGPHYQAASAATDLAVPLILKADNQVSKARASVAAVYQQVIKDLQEALATPELPNSSKDAGMDIIHPDRGAAFALLARTYLYMANYTEANNAASAALKINDKLFDYRNLHQFIVNSGGGFIYDGRLVNLLDYRFHPEALLVRVNSVETMMGGLLNRRLGASDELVALFDKDKDKRYMASFMNGNIITTSFFNFPNLYVFGYRYLGEAKEFQYLDNGIGVPEMMLTKAECLARANDPAGAITLLNHLRDYRMVNQQPLSTSVDAETALKWVLDERRRELMFKGGTRLFDLKRLNLDPRFRKEIVRGEYDDNFEPIAGKWVTLPPGSPNYLIPFTSTTLAANPLLVQNPRVNLQ